MTESATQKEYEKQRFERLKEIVGDYLDDEGDTAAKFLHDLQRAALENSQYFVSRVDAYTTVKDFFS